MIGRLPPTQIIIIHGGQIIMNQTHGVDHFQSDSRWHGGFVAAILGEHFAGRQTQDGSDALSTGHERVLHGLNDLFGFGFIRNQGFIESLFDVGESVGEVGVEVELGFDRLGRQGGDRAQSSSGRRGKGGGGSRQESNGDGSQGKAHFSNGKGTATSTIGKRVSW